MHHLESRKVGGNAPNNLITLCDNCHEKIHKGLIKKTEFKKRKRSSTRDAAFMGIMRKTLIQRLQNELSIPVLETKGYITSTNNKFRTISLLVDNEYDEKNEDVVKVPLLGKVTAGSPITAIETPNEFFDLPASLVPKNEEVFTLHVSGESMINAGIFDDDYVIIKRCNNAHNGDIVVAMTLENEVTLKRFYKENGHIRLQPENDTMTPIILPDCKILGTAIGLYRKL